MELPEVGGGGKSTSWGGGALYQLVQKKTANVMENDGGGGGRVQCRRRMDANLDLEEGRMHQLVHLRHPAGVGPAPVELRGLRPFLKNLRLACRGLGCRELQISSVR